MASTLLLFNVFVFLLPLVLGDVPVYCMHEDLMGDWNFYVSAGGNDRTLDCSNPGPATQVISMTFTGEHTVIKNTDNEIGTFELISTEGFEVVIGYRKMFAYFKYEYLNETESKYWCDETMYGWSHDNLGNDWACFVAVKQTAASEASHDRAYTVTKDIEFESFLEQTLYSPPEGFIEAINNAQDSWKAREYPEYRKLTYAQMLKRAGYKTGGIKRPKVSNKKPMIATYAPQLPESLDWRNVDGINYDSPVRDQGHCGSCFAFASTGMLEGRIRILTNNTQTPIFSTQDILSCSQYTQGCDGGFAYLTGGKYAQDFGVIEEACYPYLANNTESCEPVLTDCQRTYAAEYEYIGGYYGGSTEQNMMEDLVANGPIAVGIEVYDDFDNYESGIYHHVESVKVNKWQDNYNPYEWTNHAVLIVGYGVDAKSGEKYWIVKNSWGADWGEKGYIRVRKGTDEIAIESKGFRSVPIPQLH